MFQVVKVTLDEVMCMFVDTNSRDKILDEQFKIIEEYPDKEGSSVKKTKIRNRNRTENLYTIPLYDDIQAAEVSVGQRFDSLYLLITKLDSCLPKPPKREHYQDHLDTPIVERKRLEEIIKPYMSRRPHNGDTRSA
jgi:hypothetical protein